MKQKRRRIQALLAVSIGLAFVMLLGVGVRSARAGDLHLDGTPPPVVTLTPDPVGGGDIAGSGSSTVRTTVTNIFYHLRFPSETISAALGKVFTDAAGEQSNRLAGESAVGFQTIGEILQAPGAGDYARVAQSSWPVAAALAPALFILRIALYHWNRLMGGQIVYAGPNDGWGNLVVIENGDTQVWYGYLLEIDGSAGQVVQRGDGVGLSGGATPPTGNSTGAHFHEGIKRRDGDSYKWIDPLQFLDASEWLDTSCR